MKPEFVDNREGNTLAEAIRTHLEWLERTYADPVELSVATCYFNPEGFALIADRVERLPKVRLLIGAEPTSPPVKPWWKPGELRGASYDAAIVNEALRRHAEGLKSDRDLLGFAPEVDEIVRRLVRFLRSGRVEVRRYEKAFVHGKAFVFGSDEGVIAGSSNFTAGGLVRNLELNLGRYDPTPVLQVKQWFEDLWAESTPFDLAELYDARYREYDPYLIYLRVLWELYGEELEEERGEEPVIRLTTFQNDGLFRARRILDTHNGVLIADGVGLGKTFLAGELLREALQDRRQRALLICPAALRDGTWDRFVHTHGLYVEKYSYEQLADDVQLGGAHGYLKQSPNDYALVVIDEAQAFRNPDTRRARALRRLLRGRPPKKLVLLSATPVNNSLWDLYYLLTYFIRHDAAFADRGIPSLKQRFQQASADDPFDLQPALLFDILDATTVRRTRHFVRRYYPGDMVRRPDGTEVLIRFPEPHLKALNYELDDILPGFFDRFTEALAPEAGEPKLSLARYRPSSYRAGAETDPREMALVGFLRSALLKRFESSVHAFGRTARRMADANEAFLAALDAGYIPTPEAIDEWGEVDSDEAFEELLRETGAQPAIAYDVARLRADVEGDLELLRGFADEAAAVGPGSDPKLARLIEALAHAADQARQGALDDGDFRDRRKIIVFSYFEDTVDWIEEHLLDAVERDPRLAYYRGRIASVSGRDSRRGISREAAIFGFTPMSSEAPPGQDDDRFDILVTTDALAEGQNLQQCRNLINYDLPWNPMRLAQRHGRIDRIGSPHPNVYVFCFFPDRRLEALLDLEARIRRKLAQAAASIGVESEVIPGAATGEIVFAETREEIEALRRENPELLIQGGEDPAAHSGEEYRQELRKGFAARGREIRDLPWAAGSGLAEGARRGHFFCARVGDRVFLRFVPEGDGEVVRDTLGCLRIITCGPDTERRLADDLLRGVYGAWNKARDDIYREWSFATDPANLQPRVRPLFRKAADHLRRYPPEGTLQDDLDRVVEALEAPWGARIEREVRAVFEGPGADPYALSSVLVEKVRELGLEPFVAPEPLPPIDPDEVALICWMAVECNSGGA